MNWIRFKYCKTHPHQGRRSTELATSSAEGCHVHRRSSPELSVTSTPAQISRAITPRWNGGWCPSQPPFLCPPNLQTSPNLRRRPINLALRFSPWRSPVTRAPSPAKPNVEPPSPRNSGAASIEIPRYRPQSPLIAVTGTLRERE